MYRILSIGDLRRLGYTTSDIRCARACCLVRLSREVYVVKKMCSVHHRSPLRLPTAAEVDPGDGSPAPEVRSHISAAIAHGLAVAYPVTHHVEVTGPRAGRHSPDTSIGGSLGGGPIPMHHRCRIGGRTVTTIERTLIDVARAQCLDISVAMIDDALHRGLTTMDEILTTYAQCLDRRNAEKVGLALDLCDARRESPEESITAVRFHQFGFVGFEVRTTVRMPRSAEGDRVGLRHRAARLIVEVDGINAGRRGSHGQHGEPSESPEEVRSPHEQGFRIVRLAWTDLFEEEKFDRIRKHLRSHTGSDGGRGALRRRRRSTEPTAADAERRGGGW